MESDLKKDKTRQKHSFRDCHAVEVRDESNPDQEEEKVLERNNLEVVRRH